MRRALYLLPVTAVVLSVAGFAGFAGSSDRGGAEVASHGEIRAAREADAAGWHEVGNILAGARDAADAQAQARLAYAVRANAYARALAAAQAEEAASRAARAPNRPPRAASSGQSVGGACGGATNGADRFIARESGGNPNARNRSGAWGCYQIMPGTWAGSCSDLGVHGSASVEAQAACASRLPSSSWSASGPT